MRQLKFAEEMPGSYGYIGGDFGNISGHQCINTDIEETVV